MKTRPEQALAPLPFFLGLAAITFLIRFPDLFTHFQDWDEAAMMSQAWAMTRGQVLYKDIFQIHPALNIALFVPFFLVFSPETAPHAVKVLNAGLILACALALRRTAARWFEDFDAAAAASAIFVCLFAADWTLSSHGEFYAVLPILLAAGLLFPPAEASERRFLLAGLLFATAFHLKQTAVFDGAALLAGSLYLGPASGRARKAGLAAAGFATVSAALLLPFWARDAAADAAGATWMLPLVNYTGFSRSPSLLEATGPVLAAFVRLLESYAANLHALALAAAAAVSLALRRSRLSPGENERLALFAAAWLCADAAGLSMIGRFYPHYLLQLIPPTMLLAAYAFSAAPRPLRRALPRAALVLAAAMALRVASSARSRLALAGWETPRTAQSRAAAEFVRAHTSPQDRIFLYKVWNLDIHYLAQRLSPNGIYMFIDMVSDHSNDAETERRARAALLSDPPKAILVDPTGWLFPSAETFFRRLLKERYRPAATVDGIRIHLRKDDAHAAH